MWSTTTPYIVLVLVTQIANPKPSVMVAPQKKNRAAVKQHQSSPSSSSSYYLLLAVKILLVLIILFMLPRFVTGAQHHRSKRSEIKLRSLRWECQNDSECAIIIPEESLNCVNRCISSACYSEIFAEQPLEDGEVDIPRAKAFEACVKEELCTCRSERKALACAEAFDMGVIIKPICPYSFEINNVAKSPIRVEYFPRAALTAEPAFGSTRLT